MGDLGVAFDSRPARPTHPPARPSLSLHAPPADALAGLLWGCSLFFASPLQQLLLFLGKIETERPSDWIIMGLARGPLGLE